MDIPNVLTRLAQRHNKKFIYRGEQLPLEQVFAYDGALHIFIKRADMLADFLFGRRLHTSAIPDGNALIGEKVVIQDEESTFILVMLLYDVLEEMVSTASGEEIVLD